MWTTALGWLAETFGMFGSLVPQYHHLLCTDIGVSITRGDKIKVLEPGLIWYWPFWTDIYHRAANIQTVRVPPQSTLTKDGRSVVARGMVRYSMSREPEDVKLAIINVDEVDSAIIDETLAVICDSITERTFEEIQNNRKSMNTKITLAVRARLKNYGVNTERAQLTDFCTCRPIHHIGISFEELEQPPT